MNTSAHTTKRWYSLPINCIPSGVPPISIPLSKGLVSCSLLGMEGNEWFILSGPPIKSDMCLIGSSEEMPHLPSWVIPHSRISAALASNNAMAHLVNAHDITDSLIGTSLGEVVLQTIEEIARFPAGSEA